MEQNEKFKDFAEAIIPEATKTATNFSVMFFELIDGNWELTGKHRFTDYKSALDCYANTQCPASQLIEAESEEALEIKEGHMIECYKSEEWLNINLYPFI